MYCNITLTHSLYKQTEIQANLSDSIHILQENQGTMSFLLKLLGHHLTPRFSMILWCTMSRVVINNILTFPYSLILALAWWLMFNTTSLLYNLMSHLGLTPSHRYCMAKPGIYNTLLVQTQEHPHEGES